MDSKETTTVSKEMKIVSIDDLSIGDQFHYPVAIDMLETTRYRVLGIWGLSVSANRYFYSKYLCKDACVNKDKQQIIALHIAHGSIVINFDFDDKCMISIEK